MALTRLVLLKSARFVVWPLVSRRALLLRLRWAFGRVARLNIGFRNLLAHVFLSGNILRLIDGGCVAVEWLLFLSRFLDVGTLRLRGFNPFRSFRWSPTPSASISSAAPPWRSPAPATRRTTCATGALRTACFLSHLFRASCRQTVQKQWENSPFLLLIGITRECDRELSPWFGHERRAILGEEQRFRWLFDAEQ